MTMPSWIRELDGGEYARYDKLVSRLMTGSDLSTVPFSEALPCRKLAWMVQGIGAEPGLLAHLRACKAACTGTSEFLVTSPLPSFNNGERGAEIDRGPFRSLIVDLAIYLALVEEQSHTGGPEIEPTSDLPQQAAFTLSSFPKQWLMVSGDGSLCVASSDQEFCIMASTKDAMRRYLSVRPESKEDFECFLISSGNANLRGRDMEDLSEGEIENFGPESGRLIRALRGMELDS